MLAGSLALFGGVLVSVVPSAGAMDAIVASDVQIRATAPGMTATGGYLTIHNHSGYDHRLVGVAADFAAKTEIHSMVNENGVMKMRHLPEGIAIPAGGMVELAPGGLHLMLMGLKQTLQAGQMLEIELTFASGLTMHLKARAKRPGDISFGDGGMSGGQGHSHNHSHNHSHDDSGN